MDAFRSGQPVLVADVAAAEELRWPAFTTAIGDAPVRGMYVFPLRVGARHLGVLNVYRDRPGVLGPVELAAALRATDSVVLALLESGTEESALMGTAPHGAAPRPYRAEVHQATGMITEQAGIDAASALARLRAAAFAAGRSIDELAQDVVTRRVRFEPDRAAPTDRDGAEPRDDIPG